MSNEVYIDITKPKLTVFKHNINKKVQYERSLSSLPIEHHFSNQKNPFYSNSHIVLDRS